MTDHGASRNMRGNEITHSGCSDFDGSDRCWRTSLIPIGGSVPPFVWIKKPQKKLLTGIIDTFAFDSPHSLCPTRKTQMTPLFSLEL